MHRYASRRRRRPTRKSKRMNIMQTNGLSYQQRKYTAVFDLVQEPGNGSAQFVISHIGGGNTNSPINPAQPTGTDTLTLGRCDTERQVEADMTLNQQFKIKGVMWKCIFSQNTQSPSVSQWEAGYSPDLVFRSNLPSSSLQTLASY